MADWKIAGGPRWFEHLDGWDDDGGWTYDISRGDEQRQVGVVIAGGRTSAFLPPDCKQALATEGRSAVEAVLVRDDPPRFLVITTTGVQEHAPLT